MEFFGDFLKTFLEGSVDHIIYRDYIANRRSFIDCSLASVPQAVGPTTIWYCVDWQNAGWFNSGSSIQINLICFVWSQLRSLVVSEREPLLNWKNLFGIHTFFALLLSFALCFSLWAKHGGHSSGFSRGILLVIGWSCLGDWQSESVHVKTQKNEVEVI